MLWAQALLAAFLASLVECVEALTIVLAVGTVGGWRSALTGAVAGALLLLVTVLALGPALGRLPLHLLQLVIGALLLLFGMRWLRKAILRAAGLVPLHDEAAVFARETARLDAMTAMTAFKAVLLEGVEVVFVVLAVGAAGGMLLPAGLGAALAALAVTVAGVAVHRPLARVPENSLKLAVGVILSSYGVFWLGEGQGLDWPGGDMALLGLALFFLAVALAGVRLARRPGLAAVG